MMPRKKKADKVASSPTLERGRNQEKVEVEESMTKAVEDKGESLEPLFDSNDLAAELEREADLSGSQNLPQKAVEQTPNANSPLIDDESPVTSSLLNQDQENADFNR